MMQNKEKQMDDKQLEQVAGGQNGSDGHASVPFYMTEVSFGEAVEDVMNNLPTGKK